MVEHLSPLHVVVENILVQTLTISLVGGQWTRLEDKDIMTRIGIALILVTRGRGALKKASNRGVCKLAMASLPCSHLLQFSVSVHPHQD